MKATRSVALVMILVFSATATSGCTSLQAVPLSVGSSDVPAVEVGDHVVVTKRHYRASPMGMSPVDGWYRACVPAKDG